MSRVAEIFGFDAVIGEFEAEVTRNIDQLLVAGETQRRGLATDTGRQGAQSDLNGSTDLAKDLRLGAAPQALGQSLRITALEEVIQQGINPGRIARGERSLRIAQWRQIDVANHLMAPRLGIAPLMPRPQGRSNREAPRRLVVF